MKHARTTTALALSLACAGAVRDPSAPAADAKRTIALVIGLVVVAIVLVRSRPIGRSRAWTCALGFVATSALSAWWGIPSGALDLGAWIAALAVGLFAASTGRAHAIATLRTTALVLGGAASVVALVELSRGGSGMRLEGGQGNPNWLGLLVAVTLPISVDAARRGASIAKTFSIAATLVQLPGLYLSHSRVAWLAVAIALPLVFVAKSTTRARLAVGAMAIVAMVTVGAFAMRTLEHTSRELDESRDAPIGVAFEGRLSIARVSARAAVDALPFGAGLGRFGHVYLEEQGRALSSLPPREAARRFVNATTAHDEWLQVAIESGPIALAFLLAAFAFAGHAHLRGRYAAGTASLVACAICATADSPLRQPAIVLVVALVIAAVPARPSRTTAWPRAWVVATLAGSVFLLAASTRSWLGARLRTRAREELPEARVATLAKSARLDPASGESAFDLGLARLELDDPDGALTALTKSDRLLADLGTPIAIGNAYLAAGRPADAVVAYRRAVTLDPGSQRAQANLADAERRLGHFEEADAHAKIALAIAPGNGAVRALLDRIARDRFESAIDR